MQMAVFTLSNYPIVFGGLHFFFPWAGVGGGWGGGQMPGGQMPGEERSHFERKENWLLESNRN